MELAVLVCAEGDDEVHFVYNMPFREVRGVAVKAIVVGTRFTDSFDVVLCFFGRVEVLGIARD